MKKEEIMEILFASVVSLVIVVVVLYVVSIVWRVIIY